jgi:hypothetical protein
VVKAAQLVPSQIRTQYELGRSGQPLFDDFEDSAWTAPAPYAADAARSTPFPHTDLRRVQLLGTLDAMINSAQPPPLTAIYEVLSTLERFHAIASQPQAAAQAEPARPSSAYPARRPSAPAAGARPTPRGSSFLR